MDAYDPQIAPDPEAWLALDEGERIALIEYYHREAGVDVPSLKGHAAIHAVVENQVAMGEELPVCERLRQLMAQGLDRHEALHAIMSVLAQHLVAAATGKVPEARMNQIYFQALKRISAKKWLGSR